MLKDRLKHTQLYSFAVYSGAAVVCGYWVGWYLAIVDDEIYKEPFTERLLKARILAIICYLSGFVVFLLLSKTISFLFLLPKNILSSFIPNCLGVTFFGSLFVAFSAPIYLQANVAYHIVGFESTLYVLPVMALAQLSVYLYENKKSVKDSLTT